jgi:hypothetical protein
VINRAAFQPICNTFSRSPRTSRLSLTFIAILFATTSSLLALDPVNNLFAVSQTKTDVSDKSDAYERSMQPDTSSEPSKTTDSPEKSSSSKTTDPPEKSSQPGDPLAPGKMQLIKQEILAGIAKRQTTDNFARFRSYTAMKLNTSAGRYTGSELTGNCRLSWYDHILRNHLDAPAEAERFTRELHKAALGDHEGLAELLAIAAKKMDLAERKPRTFVKVESPEQALEIFKQSIADAEVAYAAALAPLTKSQINELQTNIYPVLVGQNQVGHTLNDRGTGRRLTDLMEMMDRNSLFAAADALVPITDPELLEQLKSLPADGDFKVEGVTGTVVDRLDTPYGAIVIGGKGANNYNLDKMPGICAVIDLGGNDTYIEGTVGLDRPVLVVADLAGRNVYRGTKPGIQGGAILGVSMLLNLGGHGVYEAKDVAQGSAVAGIGILVDYDGNSRYRGLRRVQGQALGGLGLLIERGGKNDFHAAMWAQGFGGPLGFGLLDCNDGNNHYYCGGMWRDSYPETPGYEGFGQGVGAGLRAVADGGIGVILDNGGENVYEFDYLSHGGGYWCGLGFARDFGGNTKRLITRTAYNGGPRTQPSFQRFGCGWGCHYAMGFCFDDGGDDVYEGTIMGTGMAWDCSMGVLCDFGGNDHYKATGGLTQGSSNQMGLGILYDYNGDDLYEGYTQGYASPSMSYHPLPACGGNFAFLIDYGGNDKYGCGANNNSYIDRGCAGGFLIDRPQSDEVQPTAKKNPPVSTVGR